MNPAAELCCGAFGSPSAWKPERFLLIDSAYVAHNGEFKSKELQNSINSEAMVGLEQGQMCRETPKCD